MFITNHVLAGAVIGLVAPRRPAKVALVAVGSHFVLDSVPHWGIHDDDAKFRKVAIVDGLVGLATMRAVMGAVPRGTRVAVLAGMLGAAFPDSDKPALMFFGRSPFPTGVDRFHARIQRESKRGVRTELRAALALVAAVRLLSWLRRLQVARLPVATGARGADARGVDARGADARGADARGAGARGADRQT